MERIEITAWHEAGHAVAAMAVGAFVGRVTIVRGQGYLGRCYTDSPDQTPSQRIIVTAAGWGAEALAMQKRGGTPREPEEAMVGNAGRGDYYGLREAAQALDPSPDKTNYKAILEEASQWVRKILETHWAAVEEMASTLLQKQTIEFAEAREIFNKHLTPQTEIWIPEQTMKLFDEYDQLVASRARAKAASDQQAKAQYVDLLGRAESPNPGDAEKLDELMALFGISRAQAMSDAATMRGIVDIRRQVDEMTASLAPLNAAIDAARDRWNELKRLNADSWKIREADRLLNDEACRAAPLAGKRDELRRKLGAMIDGNSRLSAMKV